MKNIRIIILAILLTFISCDIFYHVQINGTYTTEMKLECGPVFAVAKVVQILETARDFEKYFS